ncbi:MAG TPA: hypothetical protein VG325_20475 [Solirubrobacteraceae bacterium]|jgi:hypothetical protein|nr:hypothetical protein [Solirubrobacteraceae bacterium]
MSEHPPRPESDEEFERERRESTDLGYRDTEEERAYEEAERDKGKSDSPAAGHGGSVGGG